MWVLLLSRVWLSVYVDYLTPGAVVGSAFASGVRRVCFHCGSRRQVISINSQPCWRECRGPGAPWGRWFVWVSLLSRVWSGVYIDDLTPGAVVGSAFASGVRRVCFHCGSRRQVISVSSQPCWRECRGPGAPQGRWFVRVSSLSRVWLGVYFDDLAPGAVVGSAYVFGVRRVCFHCGNRRQVIGINTQPYWWEHRYPGASWGGVLGPGFVCIGTESVRIFGLLLGGFSLGAVLYFLGISFRVVFDASLVIFAFWGVVFVPLSVRYLCHVGFSQCHFSLCSSPLATLSCAPPMSDVLQVGSCWSGGGTTALLICDESSRSRLVFVCEKDARRQRLLAALFPGVALIPDVTRLSAFPDLVSRCHVLLGEFSCQDCSALGAVSGSRLGLLGSRSGTVLLMLCELGSLRRQGRPVPGLLLFENVPGLLTLPGGAGMGELRRVAAEAGYICGEWRTVDAGVWAPGMRRERVVLAMWSFPCSYAGLLLYGDFPYAPVLVDGLSSFYLSDPLFGGMAGRVRTLKTTGTLCCVLRGGLFSVSARQRCLLMGVDYSAVSQYLEEREVVALSGDGLVRGMGQWMVGRVVGYFLSCYHRPVPASSFSVNWEPHAAGWWDPRGFSYCSVGLAPVAPQVDVSWLFTVFSRGRGKVPTDDLRAYHCAQLARRRVGNPSCPEGVVLRGRLFSECGEEVPGVGTSLSLRLTAARGGYHRVVVQVVGFSSGLLFPYVLRAPGGMEYGVELLPQGQYFLLSDPLRVPQHGWYVACSSVPLPVSLRPVVSAEVPSVGGVGRVVGVESSAVQCDVPVVESSVQGGCVAGETALAAEVPVVSRRVTRAGAGVVSGGIVPFVAPLVSSGGMAVVPVVEVGALDDVAPVGWRVGARVRRIVPVSPYMSEEVRYFCSVAVHSHTTSRNMGLCAGCLADRVYERLSQGKRLGPRHFALLRAQNLDV